MIDLHVVYALIVPAAFCNWTMLPFIYLDISFLMQYTNTVIEEIREENARCSDCIEFLKIATAITTIVWPPFCFWCQAPFPTLAWTSTGLFLVFVWGWTAYAIGALEERRSWLQRMPPPNNISMN